MSEKLKPCPFCGDSVHTYSSVVGINYVACFNCGASGPSMGEGGCHERWNRRATTEYRAAPVNKVTPPWEEILGVPTVRVAETTLKAYAASINSRIDGAEERIAKLERKASVMK
jgi:Lar family restriction alleviation protein